MTNSPTPGDPVGPADPTDPADPQTPTASAHPEEAVAGGVIAGAASLSDQEALAQAAADPELTAAQGFPALPPEPVSTALPAQETAPVDQPSPAGATPLLGGVTVPEHDAPAGPPAAPAPQGFPQENVAPQGYGQPPYLPQAPAQQPSAQQPAVPQPYGQQPYVPQPHGEQPYVPQPYAQQQYAPQPVATNPGLVWGIIGLVLSVVSAGALGIVGLILSIVGLRKSKRAGHKNIPAVIGIVLASLTILFWLAIVALLIFANPCNSLGTGEHLIADEYILTCS